MFYVESVPGDRVTEHLFGALDPILHRVVVQVECLCRCFVAGLMVEKGAESLTESPRRICVVGKWAEGVADQLAGAGQVCACQCAECQARILVAARADAKS